MRIGIVGLGYVGLPLAVAFAEAGHDVIGVDVDAHKVARCATARSHIEDIPDERLRRGRSTRCTFTTRFVELHEARRDPRLRPDAADAATASRTSGRCSTRRAGAGRRAASAASSSCSSRRPTPARRASTWCRCSRSPACAPARTSTSPSRPSASIPGRTDYTLRTTPKVVGGLTDGLHRARRGALRARLRRRRAASRRPRSPSCRSCSRTSSARSTSRSSTRWRCSPTAWASTSGRSSTPPRPSPTASCASSPGPGMGGHCLPVDPFYLTWKAREYDISTEFIELAGKVNQQMPYFCVEKIERALNDAGKPVAGSRIARPRRRLQGRRRRHARVAGAEDHRACCASAAPTSPTTTRTCPSCPSSGCAASTLDEALDGADLAVIVTAHPGVDHEAVAARRRSSWTCAASRATSRPPASCSSSGDPGRGRGAGAPGARGHRLKACGAQGRRRGSTRE